MLKTLFIFFIFFSLGSCGLWKQSRLSATEYLTWYENPLNPLKSMDTTANGAWVELSYRPIEYDAAKCMQTSCAPKDSLKGYLQVGSKTLDFVLRYNLPNQNMFNFNSLSEIRSYDRMEYFAFEFKNDILLITEKNDTIQCSNLFFERTGTDFPVGIFEFSFPFVAFENIKTISICNRAIHSEKLNFLFGIDAKKLPKLKV